MAKLSHTAHNLEGLGARAASVGLGAKGESELLPLVPYPMRRTLLDGGGPPWVGFEPSVLTFTPAMRKAIGTGSAFDRGLLVQGLPDGSGTPDVVSYPRGNLVGNQTQVKYANLDPYQGTIIFSIRPFWNGDDGIQHYILHGEVVRLYKSSASSLVIQILNAAGAPVQLAVDVSAWTAGTTYLVAVRWNSKKPLDGNNLCITINNVSTFGGTGLTSVYTPSSSARIGISNVSTSPLQAILSGFTIYDRVLTGAGGYGVDVGNTPGSDELTTIYNAGTPRDAVEVTGADNVVFCAPTDQQDTVLAGTLQAWSYPLESSIPHDALCSFGEVVDSQYAVLFNGTSTVINCGSGATLDDIAAGGHLTVAFWARADGYGEGNNGRLVTKGVTNTSGFRISISSTYSSPYVRVECATSAATGYVINSWVPDGIWHHWVVYYNDTTKRIYIARDGVWLANAGAVGVGAYVSDAAESLYIGNESANAYTWNGGIGWVAVWNDDHHVAGTNFIPPRTCPGAGGSLVESWALDEGTGVTCAATVTSPANDGTITSGTWRSMVQSYGSPVVPPYLALDGVATTISHADNVAYRNLPATGIDVEVFYRLDAAPGSTRYGLRKGTGWFFYVTGTGVVSFYLTTDATSRNASTPASMADGCWHLYRATYNEAGDRLVRLYVDGILVATSGATTGTYAGDTGSALTHPINSWPGAIGPYRVSNIIRVAATHTPANRANVATDWALPDANTVLQVHLSAGAGTTAVDQSATGVNGTITLGSGKWVNSTDLAVVEPGARVYNTGYTLGADAVGDGCVIRMATTADRDLVTQIALGVDESGRGVWDVELVGLMTLRSPSYHGTATGGAGDTIIDTGARWPQSMRGVRCHNITQGTSGLVTAVSGDMTTLTVAGINGNVGDEYLLKWDGGNWRHPWKELFVTYENSASIDLRIKSVDGEGMLRLHRMDVQYSAFKHGDCEAGAGNPWLPTGWANVGLDAGDTQASSTGGAMAHSGADAVQWNAGAVNGEYMLHTFASATEGQFSWWGGWYWGDGGARFVYASTGSAVHYYSQSDLDRVAPSSLPEPTAVYWQARTGVMRNYNGTASYLRLIGTGGAVAARYSDDIFAIYMAAVTLTVTPQSQANSVYGAGLLLNGRDQGPQPIVAGTVSPSYADVRWSAALRHSDPNAVAFSATPYLAVVWGDANNYAAVYWTAASTLRVIVMVGGVPTSANWATGGAFFTVGVSHQYRLLVTGTGARLYVDGVLRATAAAAVAWATVPTQIYWASTASYASHEDAVYAAY